MSSSPWDSATFDDGGETQAKFRRLMGMGKHCHIIMYAFSVTIILENFVGILIFVGGAFYEN